MVCLVPSTTTDPRYVSFGKQRLSVTPKILADFATIRVEPFLAQESGGRYTAVFEPTTYITLTDTDSRYDCLTKASAATTAPYTNVLVSDNSIDGMGLGTPGRVSLSPNAPTPDRTSPPSVTQRGAWVAGSSIVEFPAPYIVAHEIGHSLDWPHSYIESTNQYDNPMDLMSGPPGVGGDKCTLPGYLPYPCKPQHTIAFNRFAAGWIDPANVVVHKSAVDKVILSAPLKGGTQFIAVPDSAAPTAVLTIEARPAVGADIGQTASGVAVHFIDQRPVNCANLHIDACPSLYRRQGQAFGRPNTYDHVLAPGQHATIGGVTITVVEPAGTGWLVTVSGTFSATTMTWGAMATKSADVSSQRVNGVVVLP
jgi:hypothetical protein